MVNAGLLANSASHVYLSISVLNGAAMVAKGAASRKGKPTPQIE